MPSASDDFGSSLPPRRSNRRDLLSSFGMLGIGAALAPSAFGRTVYPEGPDARVYNARQEGAAGDGRADDGPVFQRIVDQIAAAGKGVLYIPPGDYRIGGLVSVETPMMNLSIVGDGQGVSNLFGDNPDGVFRFVHSQVENQTTVANLSFFTRRDGAGTALEVNSTGGNRHNRSLVVQNVEMRGADRQTGYFDYGIKSLGQWRPLFLNVIFAGPFGRGVPEERIFKATAGIVADESYAPSFQNCYMWSLKTGYRIISRNTPTAPEDTAFYRAFAVECIVGIDIRTESYEPQLEIDTCHINCREVGIRLYHRKYFSITNCLMYNVDFKSKDPGYTDIELIGSFGGIIADNIFHQPANRNRKMIDVREESADLQITRNLFNAVGTAVHIEPEARNIVCTDNQYHRQWTGKMVDGALGNLVFGTYERRGALLGGPSPGRIPSGEWMDAGWGATEYDTDAFRDETGALVIPDGKGIQWVRLAAGLAWPAAGGGFRKVEFTKNGDASFLGNGRASLRAEEAGGETLTQDLRSAVVAARPGDVFRVRVQQTSGAPTTLDASSWFSLEVING